MASHNQQLRNPPYRDWVKAGLALKYLKDGIEEFVDAETKEQQNNLLQKVQREIGRPDATCNSCPIDQLLHYSQRRYNRSNLCPYDVCHRIFDKIVEQHMYRKPSWSNTDSTKWCTDHWEVAKCFIDGGGYRDKLSAADTDCKGLLSIITNSMFVQRNVDTVIDKIEPRTDVFSKSKEARNEILHNASLELPVETLHSYVDDMIQILEDKGKLHENENAKQSISKLRQLKRAALFISTEDEWEIREEALKAIDEKKQEAIETIEKKTNETLETLCSDKCLKTAVVLHQIWVHANLKKELNDVKARLDKNELEPKHCVCCCDNKKGHVTLEGIVSLGKFVMHAGTKCYRSTAAIFERGIDRLRNPAYEEFTSVLMIAQKSFNDQNKRLSQYDYAYWASPVAWRWKDVNVGEVKKLKIQAANNRDPPRSRLSIPTDILSYICANTFGRRMVYPGATVLINTLVEGPLCQDRTKLVEEKQGERAKLLTKDNNEIDTMFVDRRKTPHSRHGKTLVVTCEGNAGFYEIGAMATPLDLDYSVIGWNHPGFAGSTGVPFPSQEQCAIDAVMQYSIHELGFTPDNIILYAWSIGGYSATWAAMNYPDVKFVILDATFDEMMPLALAKMPEFAKSLVEKTVNRYLNLDIASQLVKYPGPVFLIRRSRDEMLTTLDPSAIHTNRGNFLLTKLLQYRYPNIVDNTSLPVLEEWLSKEKNGQDILMATHEMDREWCTVAMASYMQEAENTTFPLDIGTDYTEQQKKHMTLFLASNYMEDFNSTHCTPLPTQFFRKPWTPL